MKQVFVIMLKLKMKKVSWHQTNKYQIMIQNVSFKLDVMINPHIITEKPVWKVLFQFWRRKFMRRFQQWFQIHSKFIISLVIFIIKMLYNYFIWFYNIVISETIFQSEYWDCESFFVQMETLLPKVLVDMVVINCWAGVLNEQERYRSEQSPARYYFKTNVFVSN